MFYHNLNKHDPNQIAFRAATGQLFEEVKFGKI